MRYLVFGLILLSGCAKPGGWAKNGASDQDFAQDRGQCVAQAFAAPMPYQQRIILVGCMQGKGWYWKED